MTSATRWGFEAIRALIDTRFTVPAAERVLVDAGAHPTLAARSLDLAVTVAARELLASNDKVVLPDRYQPTVDIAALPTEFDQCEICAELTTVYRGLRQTVAIVAPVAPEVVAVNLELERKPNGPIRLRVPIIGDGFSAGFARRHFGDAAVERFAAKWPQVSLGPTGETGSALHP